MASPITEFIDRHYQHFNAATLKRAAEAYRKLLDDGGKMFVTLAGAMSTARLGVSLAEMIRQDKVHGICCTGANLEEDVFNLVARDHYVSIPEYRDLTAEEEKKLLDQGMNRVTDTCIPEGPTIELLNQYLIDEWKACDESGQRLFPHEYFFRLLKREDFCRRFQVDKAESWLYAAMEKNIPVFVPGWEDSTLGNGFAGYCYSGEVKNTAIVRSGIETMTGLIEWYLETSKVSSIGFFQIGGGIAGDFPICVVPLLRQDLELKDVPMWAYFCQISDSTTSFGSYSGAVPNEKITWEKLDVDTPKFVIESDATIVAPLMFAYVLGW